MSGSEEEESVDDYEEFEPEPEFDPGAQSSVCEWGVMSDVIVIVHALHVC